MNGGLEQEYGWFLEGVEKYISDHPEEFLAHYGVKGMKWGVRKDRSTSSQLTGLGPDKIVRKTASGETLTLEKKAPNLINKAFAKISKKYRDSFNNGAILTIKNGEGKKVGEANVWKKNDDELYLNWLGIKKTQRGKGYATAVMKSAEEFGRQQGFKKMTLEVPGNSPDARHIYEKLGFKVTKEDLDPDDPIWGGLTEMEYNFKNAKHHNSEAFLAHYGVKGMKWGVRREKDTSLATGYNKSQFNYDKRTHGKRAARRINEKVKRGEDLTKARETEYKRRGKIEKRVRLTASGLALAAMFGPGIMDAVANSGIKGSAAGAVNRRANRKREEAGAKMARDMLADERGLTNYSSIRLEFDPSTGEWK